MAGIQTQEGLFRNPTNGRRLFYRLWNAKGDRALVVIIHGFGEHGGRYTALAQAFAEKGLTVACSDLWGHGRSAGQRGDIDQFHQYLDDLEAVARHVFLAWTSQRRVVVFGHSFGGLVTIHWALQRPEAFRCLILQSPLLGVGFSVPKWKERLAASLGQWWQRLSVSTGLDPTWLSHDPSVVQCYREDPFVHRRISLRCYHMLRAAMSQAIERAASLTSPTLVLHGTEDRVISLTVCRDFFNTLACKKQLVRFPGCYHELHHESVRPAVVETVLQWISAYA